MPALYIRNETAGHGGRGPVLRTLSPGADMSQYRLARLSESGCSKGDCLTNSGSGVKLPQGKLRYDRLGQEGF